MSGTGERLSIEVPVGGASSAGSSSGSGNGVPELCDSVDDDANDIIDDVDAGGDGVCEVGGLSHLSIGLKELHAPPLRVDPLPLPGSSARCRFRRAW